MSLGEAMKRERFAALNRLEILRLCCASHDSRTLRAQLLQRLQAVIPFDYAYFSATDPATHLATSSVLAEEPPAWCMSVFLENEFLQADVNKFSHMIRRQQTVSILSQAVGSEPSRSHRYREMLAPLGMEDELRAVFIADDACWGTLCLHREKTRYTAEEAFHLSQVSRAIAEGLRKAALLNSALAGTSLPDGPGVLILSEDLTVVAATAAAAYWLAELGETSRAEGHPLPLAVRSLVAGLNAIEAGRAAPDASPKVRLQTASGHWLVLHAARLVGSGSPSQISVIFEVAQPAEIAPMIMQAYAFTKREAEVTQCVLKGLSTTEIAARLHISPHTVQDHLKAVFGKADVSSRGELAARIFLQQHRS
jgi:DNA-binding CsgD family transcriptional regulator